MSTGPLYIKTIEQTPYLQPDVFILLLMEGRTVYNLCLCIKIQIVLCLFV